MSKKVPSILVVEDNVLILISIASEMRMEGFEVHEAVNASEALEALEADLPIDVLFTDVDMPGQMDGLGLAKEVQKRWSSVKIIITSGMHNLMKTAMPEGGVFIPKPYDRNRLMETIKLQLAE